MIQTKNKIKANKGKLVQLKDENHNLRKVYQANL